VRVTLYARVSSERQAEKDLSIVAQLKALRKYAVEHGWEVHREFVDEAESARSVNRPAFKEMIALAKQRHKCFDAILVWKLSRFARNREDSIIYKSLLRKHGISVISINEQVDESPAGKLLEGMIEVIDEFYSINLAQDTLRGMKENAGRGYHNGGVIPIGYKAKKFMEGAHEKTRLEPDEIFAPIIQRIFQMCIDGMGAKEIVKTLYSEGLRTNKGKLWNKNTVYYVLKNEAYTGTLVWNRQHKSQGRPRLKDPKEIIRIEDNHPAVISHEMFEKVQALLRERSPEITHPRTINSDYLLSGFLCCGRCGSGMLGCAAKSSRFFYYACHNYCKRGKDVCNARLIKKERIEGFVIDRMKANLLTEDNLRELVKLTNEEISQAKEQYEERLAVIEAQVEEVRRRLHKLYDALETSKLDVEDLAPRMKQLKAQMDDLEEKRIDLMESIREAKVDLLEASVVRAYVDDLKGLLSKGSIVEQKCFLRSFIKRIEVNLPQVVITCTMPLKAQKVEPLDREVLPFVYDGSPGRIRTSDQVVNSHSLCRLSYRGTKTTRHI
jgi:site-specific DNA recombinase